MDRSVNILVSILFVIMIISTISMAFVLGQLLGDSDYGKLQFMWVKIIWWITIALTVVALVLSFKKEIQNSWIIVFCLLLAGHAIAVIDFLDRTLIARLIAKI